MLVTFWALRMMLTKIQVFCYVRIRLLLQTFRKHFNHVSSVSKQFNTVVTRAKTTLFSNFLILKMETARFSELSLNVQLLRLEPEYLNGHNIFSWHALVSVIDVNRTRRALRTTDCVSIPTRDKKFISSQSVETDRGAYPAPCLSHTGEWSSRQDIRIPTHSNWYRD